jgi:hypothetical protein
LDTLQLPNPEVSDISLLHTIQKSKKIVLVIARELNKMPEESILRLKDIQAACKRKKVPFAVLCGASDEAIDAFRKKHDFQAAFFVNDGTEMKVITRSNPTLMIVERGVIKAKYPHRSIPTKEEFKEKHLK